MNSSHSPRVPLLSQLPAPSSNSDNNNQSKEQKMDLISSDDSDQHEKQQNRQTQSRKSSLASSTHSIDGIESAGTHRLTSDTANLRSNTSKASRSGTMTPDGVLNGREEMGTYDHRDDGDEEDDDLVAISGEDSLLREEGVNGGGYRQIDGPGLSSGRGMDRKTLMRKVLINLALIGSWCEWNLVTLMNQSIPPFTYDFALAQFSFRL
jgi:hypothetical protein